MDEWLVQVIKAMYENATTAVKVKGKASDEFEVKVGVHQLAKVPYLVHYYLPLCWKR